MSVTRTTYQDKNDDNQEKEQQQQQQQIEPLSDPLSISDITKRTIGNDQKELTNNQQVTDIVTNETSIDFLRCYVALDRREVEHYVFNYSNAKDTTLQKDVSLTHEEDKDLTKELQQKSQSNQFTISKTKSEEYK
ncbi:hypothetical protein I4U23_021951 [Adineta vaga]|nr:hypothetical protein I4U23_021951 [Adineta vaga]